MNFWSSNYLKATNMPAIQGRLPSRSFGDLLETSLALAKPPPPPRGTAALQRPRLAAECLSLPHCIPGPTRAQPNRSERRQQG